MPDSGIVLRNTLALPGGAETMPGRLRHWANFAPERLFLTERPAGCERSISYAQALLTVDRWSARLAGLGCGADRPLMIIAANSIDHALLMLAATSIGIPVAVVSTSYAAPSAAPYGKLQKIIASVAPGLIVTESSERLSEVIATCTAGTGGAGANSPLRATADLSWLDAAVPADDLVTNRLRGAVGQETVAKILFTSGSTGAPKGVANTQGMMASNMRALSAIWPFLTIEPPVLVDWLPWNHTFGGNCCFNLALYFGGTMHIDDGKPLPAMIGRTIDALKRTRVTAYFNVPSGFEALLPHLESDPDLARHFLGSVRFLFNAGSAMPTSTRARLEAVALTTLGYVPPIIGGYGSTETAPFSMAVYFPTGEAANLGLPIPGTEIRLTPHGGRLEIGVKGPNVMPRYWGDPAATEAAFDELGYYRMGDAARFADPERPEEGLVFDGRTAENFKLSSGTWVNVGALRLSVIAGTQPYVADAVIAGEGRDDIGALLFVHPAHVAQVSALTSQIDALLSAYNATQSGSSRCVRRFVILEEPPRSDCDEVTDKGYINQRAVLRRRSADVARLYDERTTIVT